MIFKKGNNGNELTYPVTQEQIDNLVDSKFASPKVGDSNGLRNVFVDEDINVHVKEVELVRFLIQRGEYPQDFLNKYYPFNGTAPTEITQPLINEGLSKENPNGLANVVHMDNPMDMANAILKWLVGEGCKLKDNDSDYIMFTDTILDVIEDISDGVKRFGNKAFEVKYNYGVARPEEVSSHGISITHYEEGCPTHPSYPAGHGAIAGGSVLAFFKHFDLNEEQIKVILDTAYLWSMFRTFAGVHYGVDNVAGLYLGLKKYFRKDVKSFYSE